jgi:PAS domain S-box-containing protein
MCETAEMPIIRKMAGLRPRSTRIARVLTDLCLAAALCLLWLTGQVTLWLHLAYIAVAVCAFLTRRASAIVARTVAVSLVGGADLLHLHMTGRVPADDLLEIPLMSVLTLLFAGFALLRSRDQDRVAADSLHLAEQIDALPLATVAFDGDARVITWNRAAESMFGWRRDEVVGHRNPTVKAEARAESDELHQRIRAGEHLHGVEVTREARDGRPLELALFTAPFEAGPAAGFLALYEDIAERKRAEVERDAAQLRYRALVEALPLVTYTDLVDDHATNVYTSPQVEQLLGWSVEAWAADPRLFTTLLHPDDLERVMALVHDCNEARTRFEAEYRLRHLDGHYVWVRDQSTIVQDEHGEWFARGFLLDITEQKQLEEQLLQAQKMDALGQFAGGIAHDFNNLLTGISGYAELASSGAAPGSTLTRCLDGIKTAAAEAASLTSRLLAFSRRDVPEQRLLDLNEVVRSAAELLERVVREDMTVRLVLTEPLPAVAADAAQLKQVVVNLALNARDAMSTGGVLTLETAVSGDSVLLRVRDDGCGMDAATRRRALEPFFTTKGPGEGTGLGLSVVYGVVDGLGGSVSIDSEPDEGTVVEVVLPAGGDLPERTALAPVARIAASGVERVLVVEDREVVRNLARDVLAAAGFSVHTAAGGEEAMEVARWAPPFDAVVLDVVMPGMSGPELAVDLRISYPELPVLYMSGYTDDVLGSDALAEPHTGFIRKPFAGSDLVHAVRGLLDHQLASTV